MTDPIGHLTAETSNDQGGNQFTIQQAGFNAFGESLGEAVTVPSDQGALQGTYTVSHTYSTTTGLPEDDLYPASPDGSALPAETVIHGYSPGFDLPNTLSSNLTGYAQNTTYTAFSQVAQEEIGSVSANAYITNTWTPHTAVLSDTQVTNTAVSATPYDDTSYGYNPDVMRTSETDVRNGTQTELQCFDYDTLGRLTQAWTINLRADRRRRHRRRQSHQQRRPERAELLRRRRVLQPHAASPRRPAAPAGHPDYPWQPQHAAAGRPDGRRAATRDEDRR